MDHFFKNIFRICLCGKIWPGICCLAAFSCVLFPDPVVFFLMPPCCLEVSSWWLSVCYQPTCFFVFNVVLSWTHLNAKAKNLDAHPAHVRSGHLPHQFSKLVPVLVDLLYSQGTCKREKTFHFKTSLLTNQQQIVFQLNVKRNTVFM